MPGEHPRVQRRAPRPTRPCGCARRGRHRAACPKSVGRWTPISRPQRRSPPSRRAATWETWPHPPTPPAGPVLRAFDLAPSLRAQLTEEARECLQARIARTGYYHTNLYRMLRKTSHRGGLPSPHAGSPTLRELLEAGRVTGTTREELEAGIASIHGMSADAPLLGPYPKALTPAWAWLAGLYSGNGAGIGRERQLRFNLDATVLPLFAEAMLSIGATWHAAAPRTVHGRAKTRVVTCKPLYSAFEHLGFPLLGETPGPGLGRGRAARHERRVIPEWCLATPEARHAFVEGYLNAVAQCTWIENKGHKYARFRFSIICNDDASRERFADVVENELRRAGANGVRRYPGRGGRELSLHVTSNHDFVAVTRHFRIQRTLCLEAIALGGIKRE